MRTENPLPLAALRRTDPSAPGHGPGWMPFQAGAIFDSVMLRLLFRAVLVRGASGLLLMTLTGCAATARPKARADAPVDPPPASVLLVARAGSPAPGLAAAPTGAARRATSAKPAALPSPAPRRLRVERGQNLYRIALAAGVPLKTLMRANGITNPNNIRAGQMLAIPAADAPATSSRTAERKRNARAASRRAGPASGESEPGRSAARAWSRSAQAAPFGSVPVTGSALFSGRPEPVGPDQAPLGVSFFLLPPSEAFVWPVSGGLTRSRFGQRRGRLHAGLDISAPAGSDVLAARDGTVAYSGSKFQGYGNVVMIDHGDGYLTVYAHNSENLVEEGDSVERGEVIAMVGATGNATGSHCHFEVRKDDVAVDPQRFFETEPGSAQVAGGGGELSRSRIGRSRAAAAVPADPIP